MIINQYYCHYKQTWNNEMMHVENYEFDFLRNLTEQHIFGMLRFHFLKIKLYVILNYNEKKFIFLIKNIPDFSIFRTKTVPCSVFSVICVNTFFISSLSNIGLDPSPIIF